MRQIRFRAWYKGSEFPLDNEDLEDYEKPQMIYNVQKLYDGNGPDNNPVLGGYDSFGNLIDNEEFVLQQFTGLLDNNGKEIYEGDVLRNPVYQGVVEYGRVLDGCAMAYIGFYIKVDSNTYTNLDGSLEVIGNIFENPELLKNE
jgi:uncharacterized phage protein (TIGR01671 family)